MKSACALSYYPLLCNNIYYISPLYLTNETIFRKGSNENNKLIAIEVKSPDPHFTWEIVDIYRAPNGDMGRLERLAVRTVFTGTSTKRSIIGGDWNLPYADWNGIAGCNSENQYLVGQRGIHTLVNGALLYQSQGGKYLAEEWLALTL